MSMNGIFFHLVHHKGDYGEKFSHLLHEKSKVMAEKILKKLRKHAHLLGSSENLAKYSSINP